MTAEAHQCFYLLNILISPRNVWVKKKKTTTFFKAHVTVPQAVMALCDIE